MKRILLGYIIPFIPVIGLIYLMFNIKYLVKESSFLYQDDSILVFILVHTFTIIGLIGILTYYLIY